MIPLLFDRVLYMPSQESDPTTKTQQLGFINAPQFLKGLSKAEAATNRAERLAVYSERLKKQLNSDMRKGIFYLATGEFISFDDNYSEYATFYGQIDDIDVDYFGDRHWLVMRMSNFEQAEAKTLILTAEPGKQPKLLCDYVEQETFGYDEWQEIIDTHPEEPVRFLWAVSGDFMHANLGVETADKLNSLEEALFMEYGIAVADQVVVQGSSAHSAHGSRTIPQGQISAEERSIHSGTFLGLTIYEMPENHPHHNALCVAIKDENEQIILQPCSGLRQFELESL